MSQWLNQSKKDPQKKTFQYMIDTGNWVDLRNYKSFSHFLLPAFPIHTDRFPKNVLSLAQFLQRYDSINKDAVKGNFSLIWEIFATLGWEPLSFMSFLVVKVLTKLAMFCNWWDGASKMRKGRSDVFIRRNLDSIFFGRCFLKQAFHSTMQWRKTPFVHFCLFSNMSNYRLQSLVN